MPSFLLSAAFIEKLVVGVAGAVVIKLLTLAYQWFANAMFVLNHFEIDGIWVARFDSYVGGGRRNVELVLFRQQRDRLSITIQQFNNAAGADTLQRPKRFSAEGVLRGNALSIVYSASGKNDPRTGVMMLLATPDASGDLVLKGKYGELQIGAAAPMITGDHEYVLQKATLPALMAMRFYFGLGACSSFGEADAIASSAIKPSAALAASSSKRSTISSS